MSGTQGILERIERELVDAKWSISLDRADVEALVHAVKAAQEVAEFIDSTIQMPSHYAEQLEQGNGRPAFEWWKHIASKRREIVRDVLRPALVPFQTPPNDNNLGGVRDASYGGERT